MSCSIQGFLLVLVLTVVAIRAHDDECRCSPAKMSGTFYIGIRKMYKYYIDFDQQKIVEDWAGKYGTDKVLYDLESNTRYRLRSDGSCSASALRSDANIEQCVPDSAEVENQGDKLSFSFEAGAVRSTKVVTAHTCLPVSLTKTRGRRPIVINYHDATDTVEDPSVFEVDISAC